MFGHFAVCENAYCGGEVLVVTVVDFTTGNIFTYIVAPNLTTEAAAAKIETSIKAAKISTTK
jgi:hypothetical protein